MPNDYGYLDELQTPLGIPMRRVPYAQELMQLAPPVPIQRVRPVEAIPYNPMPRLAPQPAQSTIQDSKVVRGDFPRIGKNVSEDWFTGLIKKKEGGGNYQALNKEKKGNTASGAYQYTDATWNNYGGYPKAMLAPPHVQDKRFAEDLSKRIRKYGGDIFKAAAEHYLPAYANKPETWDEPVTLKVRGGTTTVKPVKEYLSYIFRGTPYAEQLEAYIHAHK